jgi:plastocyanin
LSPASLKRVLWSGRLAAACCLWVVLMPVTARAGGITGVISAGPAKSGAGAPVAVWVNTSDGGPAPAGRLTITQRNLEFSPSLLVITAGQTVAMPNEDDVAHNVFSSSSARAFNLGIYPKGQNKEVTFTEPGIVDLRCSMHRRMGATIVVSPSRHHAIGHVGERFEIANVPAGTYELRAWSRDLGEFQGKVVVSPSGAADTKVVLTPVVK